MLAPRPAQLGSELGHRQRSRQILLVALEYEGNVQQRSARVREVRYQPIEETEIRFDALRLLLAAVWRARKAS